MQLGVFIPIGNNGWLISTTSPQYMPTFELNKTVVAVTHDAQFAALADRRIGIVDGRIDMAWRPG